MKKIITFFLTFITTISLLAPVTCYADNHQVIRVCYYPLENLTVDYNEHPYHGYYYDYLQEISQYTGWTYEYVSASYAESLSMLKSQEIDLICGIDKTESRLEQLDFSTTPLMSTKYKFYVPAENDTIYYNDYEHFDGMTVGVLNTCSQISAIDALCAEQDITIEKKYYTAAVALENALLNGEIDAIYATTVSNDSRFRIATHFSSTQLYFATWKGNDILEEIADAQKRISNTTSYFEYELFRENIGETQELIPYFTRDELAYIEKHQDVYFSADPHWAPIESTNPKTGELEGITAEILELLEEYTGLNFVYKASDSFTESLTRLKHGEVEMLTALSHDYAWAEQNNVNLSSAYLDSYIVMIHNPNNTTGKNCVALPSDFNITSQIVESGLYDNILYFDTTEECIEAVANGRADCTYTNYYIANYHLSNIAYRSLAATKITSSNENLCIAVSKDADPRLLSIINKGLRCISAQKIDAIVLEHTLYENEFSIRNIIYAYPETVILAIVAISTIAVIALLITLFIHYRKARIIENISQTDALTGILNRGAVQAQITLAIDKEKANPDLVCPLIAIDLDNFKAVNDNYGHSEGDLLLKAVAKVLTHSVRQTDIVGRMGGDEFIVYLTNVSNKKTAEKVAAKLCTAVSALSLEKEEWSEITASFGVAFGDEHSTWSTLYHQADVALYDAKEKGKNQYSIYSGE
ncbi:MAG: diguanylate cyclase [Roseburia sp.]|nr:diguanylate cyclase [Roseburia sp.]